MENPEKTQLVRELTPVESFFAYSPFSIVTLAVRNHGKITQTALQVAVEKVQQRHLHLRTRIISHEGSLWLCSSDVAPIPIEMRIVYMVACSRAGGCCPARPGRGAGLAERSSPSREGQRPARDGGAAPRMAREAAPQRSSARA